MSNAFVTTNTAAPTSPSMFREFSHLKSVAVPHHRRTPPSERKYSIRTKYKDGHFHLGSICNSRSLKNQQDANQILGKKLLSVITYIIITTA